jgi:glycosyltransferase involved in cell wall biosynthesis
VLAEWIERTRSNSVTVYTRDASVHEFVGLHNSHVLERPRWADKHLSSEYARQAVSMLAAPREGRQLAREIDSHGYDATLCFASRLTQAPDVLAWLQTPTLYYAPEPLRSAYEPRELTREHVSGLSGLVRAVGHATIGRRQASLDRRFIKSADQVVTHSRFTRDILENIYGVESEIVKLGVDSRAFHPDDVTRDGFVLSVGRIHPLKGHAFVIEAIATMPAPRPRLVVVGDSGGAESQLRQLAALHRIDLDIRLSVSFTELLDLYQRAGVVACGQIREPFGLVPLEAMACECPVVAVDEGGFRETVRHGETGLLAPRNQVAFGAAIAEVLRSEEFAHSLARQGRLAVMNNWTWEATAAGFDRLIGGLSRR